MKTVTPRGFEPLTYRLEDGCSIQLSYGAWLVPARIDPNGADLAGLRFHLIADQAMGYTPSVSLVVT